MLNNDKIIGLLNESFDSDTRSVTPSPKLVADVRRRIKRRQTRRLAALGGSAAAICAVAVAITVSGQGGAGAPTHPMAARVGPSTAARSSTPANETGQSKLLRLSAYTFKIPAQAKVSKTCLDGPETWAKTWSPRPVDYPIASYLLVRFRGGNFGYAADGGSCDGAAFVYSARHPAAVDTVTASGQPTVYIAANTANSRIGYLALDAKDSAQAAEQTHGPTGAPYYVIGEIPSDNDQSVLVSLLQQYSMP